MQKQALRQTPTHRHKHRDTELCTEREAPIENDTEMLMQKETWRTTEKYKVRQP